MLPLIFSGRVQHGEGIATSLGFPTANILIEGGVVIPALGVYVGKTELDGRSYPSLVYVNDGRYGAVLKLDVHLFGVNMDLIGKVLSVCLLEKLREMELWKDDDFIKDLMVTDRKRAQEWFANYPDVDLTLDNCG